MMKHSRHRPLWATVFLCLHTWHKVNQLLLSSNLRLDCGLGVRWTGPVARRRPGKRAACDTGLPPTTRGTPRRLPVGWGVLTRHVGADRQRLYTNRRGWHRSAGISPAGSPFSFHSRGVLGQLGRALVYGEGGLTCEVGGFVVCILLASYARVFADPAQRIRPCFNHKTPSL